MWFPALATETSRKDGARISRDSDGEAIDIRIARRHLQRGVSGGHLNMRKRTYKWLHVPTGTTGESTFEELFLSDSQAIRLVNEWSSKQRGVWVYWI